MSNPDLDRLSFGEAVGSGGAKLDDRAYGKAVWAAAMAHEALRKDEPTDDPLAEGIQAYLAAASSGELDLTDEAVEERDYLLSKLALDLAVLDEQAGRKLRVTEAAAKMLLRVSTVRKLRARLDRKDDEA